MDQLRVAFRKFKDDNSVIALFPDWVEYQGKFIQSYMHIGQHGAASPKLLHTLAPAEKWEYEALHKELQSLGYKALQIV